MPRRERDFIFTDKVTVDTARTVDDFAFNVPSTVWILHIDLRCVLFDFFNSPIKSFL